MQPDELVSDRTGVINKTFAYLLTEKHTQENISSCSMLETYNETPIFIPVDIAEDAVKSVAQKLSGSYGPVGTDYEASQRWLLKLREERKRICISLEIFVWLANKSPPWAAYCAFMSGRLIAIDKHPGIRLAGVG